MKTLKSLSILTLFLFLTSCSIPSSSTNSELSNENDSEIPSNSSSEDMVTFEDELKNFENGFSATITQRAVQISDLDRNEVVDILILDAVVNEDAASFTIRYNLYSDYGINSSFAYFRGDNNDAYCEVLTHENNVFRDYDYIGNHKRTPFEDLVYNFFKDMSQEDVSTVDGKKFTTSDDFAFHVVSNTGFIISSNPDSFSGMESLPIEGYFTFENCEITNYTTVIELASQGLFIEFDYAFSSKGYTEIPHMEALPESERDLDYENLIEQYQGIDNATAEFRLKNERPEGVDMFQDINAIIDVYFNGTEILSAKSDSEEYHYNTVINFYYYREDENVDLLSRAILDEEYVEYDENDEPHYTYYYKKQNSVAKTYDFLFPKFADISSVFFTKVNEATFRVKDGYASLVANQFIPLDVDHALVHYSNLERNNVELVLTFNANGDIEYQMTYEETITEFTDGTFTTKETFTYQETLKISYYNFGTTEFPQWTQNIEFAN